MLRRSTSAGNTTMTVYAFGLEEHRYSGSGVNQSNTYYYSLGGLLIGEFDGTNTNMYLTDALGSVLETISAAPNSAAVQGNQVYGPYGASRYQQGTMNTAKGFTGQYNDSLTGLDYYNARYYDPVVGRFLSADPVVGNLAGLDPYAYVGNDPETYSDPSGQMYAPPSGGGGNGGQYNEVLTPPPPVQSSPVQSPPGVDPYNPLTWPIFNPATEAGAIEEAAIGGSVVAGLGAVFLIGISVVIMMAPQRPNGPQYPINGPQPVPAPTPTDTKAPTATNALDTGGIALSLQPQTTPPTQTGGNGRVPPIEPPVAAAGGTCSFTSDTVVTTDHGKQQIGKSQVGEKVLAYNPKTHKMEWEPILHVWKHTDHDLVDLTLTATTKAQHGTSSTTVKTSEVLHTTSEHPFFTTEHGFVAAGNLKLDMHVLRADGSVGVITGWKVVPGTQVMYNLEVAQDHTFVVGTGQWVVHNRCSPENLSNQDARRVAQRVLNAFNDHLTSSDLMGAWGDLHGNPVPDQAGGFYDHIGEVEDALQSGRNAINAFKRLLDDPSLSEEDYCIIECLVGRISKTLDYVDKVINRDQWFEGTNILPFP